MIYNDGTFQENGDVWFVGYLDNVIYHINSDGKTEVVAMIPTEGTDTYRMNPMCIKNENEIICLPDRGKSVIIYDVKTSQFRNIHISLNSNRYAIMNGWVEGDVLWCVSYRTGELIKCNLKNKVIEKKMVCSPNHETGSGEAIKVNQYIYILHNDRCAVTEFDIRAEKSHTYELQCQDRGFGTIVYANEEFYLTGFKKNIYKWNKETNHVKTIEISKEIIFEVENCDSKSSRFFQSRHRNGEILITPRNNKDYLCDDVILFHLETEGFKKYTLKDEDNPRKLGEGLVYNYSLGDTVLIQDYSQNDYWEVNIKTDKITKRKLSINHKANDNFWKANGMNGFYHESDCLSLKNFIANIQRKIDA